MGADVGNQYKVDTGSINATPTLSGNWAAAVGATSIQSQYASARPISFGIKGVYVGSDLSNQGTIVVGQVSEKVALSSFNGASQATACSLCMNFKVFRARDGCKVDWQPIDMTDIMDWDLNLSSTVAVSSTIGRPWLVVLCYGFATGGVGGLNIDFVANYEGTFKQQDFLPGGLGNNTASPSEMGWYEKMQTYLRGWDPIDIATTASAAGAFSYAAPALATLTSTALRRYNAPPNYLRPIGGGFFAN